MSKKLYFLLFMFSAGLQAQDFIWVQTPEINITTNPDLVGYCTAVDKFNNIYTAGFKGNAYSYGEIFGDVFFNKLNTIGEVQFSKTFAGRVTVYDMMTDASGNVFMAIGYVNSVVFDTLAFLTEDQGIQPLLVKFDPSGNLLWHYTPSISESVETKFRALTVDASGNVYLGLDNFQHSYIQKLSSNGTPGAIITQTNVSMLTSLDTDTEGNIYAAGSCADPNAIFGGVSAPTTFNYNTWIVKYSPTGVFQWMQYVDDITCSRAAVRANTPDQVYFSSDLYGAYSFGSITVEGPTVGLFNDVFIAKLNASGTFEWVKEVPGGGTLDHGYRNFLATDAQGHVYFVGKTRGTINWDESTTTAAQGFSSDAIVLKFDASGLLQFTKTAGGASEDRIDAVAIDNLERIYVSGMARGNATFDEITHEAEGVTVYAFTAQIGSNVILGDEDPQSLSVKAWPNPASESIQLSGLTSPVKGDIVNLLGQRLATFEMAPNESLDVTSLPKGIYFLRIQGYAAVKFIKA